MGKGNRNSKYQEAYDMSGASAKTVKTNGKKKDMTSFWTMFAIIVLVVGALLLFVFSSTGIVDRATNIASSDSYKVDGTMITYFESQLLNQAFNTYYQYYYQMTQNAETAYNYAQQYVASQSFRDGAVDIVKELLILCEGAKAAGMTLDADDVALVDENMAQIDNVSATFGKGVMKSDIRKSIELQVLANKYYEKFTEEAKAAVTAEDMSAFIEENKASFYITDYLTTKLSVLSEDYEGDKEGFAAAKALVDEYVAKFEAAKTVDEFKTFLIEYTVKSEFDGLAATEIDSAVMPDQATLANYRKEIADGIVKLIVGGEEMTLGGGAEGTLEKAIATIKETLVTSCNKAINAAEVTQAYVEADSADASEEAKWLTASDRKLGDTHKTSTSDDTEYTYTVYMVTAPLHINDELSRNVGHILIEAREGTATEEEVAAAKTKADEVLAKYLAGDKTEESFEEIGWENTADSNVFYDNVVTGDMVEEFDAWLFDKARKVGDTGVVQTEFGFHVMLYRGEEAVSDANAKAGVVSEKYSDYLKANEGKVKINPKFVTEEAAE